MLLAPSAYDRFRYQIKPLLVFLVVAILALIFFQVGNEAIEGDTYAFDAQLLRAAQSLRYTYPWLAEMLRDLSGLGSTIVLTLATVAMVGYLVLVSARATALLVALSVISGTTLVSVFKAVFGRHRPDTAFAELVVSGLSFPSGHASMSAIVFLTAGALFASTRGSMYERFYIMMTSLLLTLLIGMSRVGLGVHWATDVLGGWAFGAAWALLWLMVARRFAA